MKANYFFTTKILLMITFCFCANANYGQNKEEIVKIIQDYDLAKIKKLQEKYTLQYTIEKAKALQAAKENNWPEFIKNEDGSVAELMKLSIDGKPLYYSINNVNAAKSTRANFLHTGGNLGLNLDGQGMTARVWDGGKTRASHQEFGDRVTVIDAEAGPTGNNFHATHVTGTIVASGVQASAKGMAPQAQARTFNWTNDLGEALSEVQQGMLLSNHSYGVPVVNNGVFAPSWYIGAYSSDSRSWDEALYNSPYYLMVASAGNNGTDNNPNPLAIGYDKLTGNKTSKNNLVVANAQDAVIAANGNLISVAINSGSSQGPTDDLRIKPDITGNGTSLYSTLETSNTAYGSLSGTSMSSPNVTGTLLLLQQHYRNTYNRFMRASTLKALACHTADDAGRPGPDVVFGWGLLNAKKAAETISNNGLSSWVSEEILEQGQTFTMTVTAARTDALMASIVWTDVPGNANDGVLNSTNRALVNDLDLRITKGDETHYPYRLLANPALNAVNDSDNNVDNIERVSVSAPVGSYTITVTHKGTLQLGPQHFSLVVTGISSGFTLISLSEDQSVCKEGSSSYNFRHNVASEGTTSFSAVGLPGDAIASFDNNSLSGAGNIVMTVSNLQNVAPGNYTIGIQGVRGDETEIRYVGLNIYSNVFENIQEIAPVSNQNGLATSLQLKWNANVNAQSYRVQVATDYNFTNIISNEVTSMTQYNLNGLSEATRYYWRVLPINICGAATSGTVYRFDTGTLSCNNIFSATDFSNATIATVANSQASVPIIVTGGLTVGKLTATLNISHTYTQDMTIYLQGPESTGFITIPLFTEPCGEYDNIVATLSDDGAELVCRTRTPAISGTFLPKEPLSTFNNILADGVWNLIVTDPYNGDGGVINSVSLDFCNMLVADLKVDEDKLANVTVYPNPSKGMININLPQTSDKTMLYLNDIQGRRILSKEATSNQEILVLGNLSDGVYILSIESGNLKTTKKIILNK